MRLLFLLTTFRGSDVAVGLSHRTQYDACFMFRVSAILKGWHRGHLFLFANVCELRLSGKHVRSHTTWLVMFGFQIDQQIAIRSTGSILIGFDAFGYICLTNVANWVASRGFLNSTRQWALRVIVLAYLFLLNTF